MRPRILHFSLLLFLISTSVTSFGQRGVMVLPRNLAELSSSARIVVVGRVLDAHVEPHPDYKNLMSVVVTLGVREVWKGQPANTITFRQFIWDLRDRADNAGYRVGDDLLLFLNPTSRVGFTSPVGMEQGRLRIIRDKSGTTAAISGSNRTLLAGLAANPSSAHLSAESARVLLHPQSGDAPIALKTLKEAVSVYTQKDGAQ